MKLEGYRKYSEDHVVYDEDVYQHIRKHSRLIDRLNPRKMVEMTEWAELEFDHAIDLPEDPNWKYYGRTGIIRY